jgi:hypothetical protein
MIRRKSNLYLAGFFITISFLFGSCGNKVIISRSDIYSTGWKNGEYQGFRIAKIKLLDSTISIYNKEFYVSDLTKHIIDSSFCYGAGRNHNIQKIMPKIYFNKESDLFDWYNCGNILEQKKTIGLLELDSWYVVKGMGNTIDYYVYIDKEGKSHTYSFGPDNW